MRKLLAGFVGLLSMAITTGPARAQSLPSFGMPGGGVSTIGTGAQTIVNTPINTNAAIVGQQPPGFLASLFPSFHLPSFPLSIGQSGYPAPSAFASTQYPNGVPRPFVPVNNVPRYLLPNGYTPSLAPGR